MDGRLKGMLAAAVIVAASSGAGAGEPSPATPPGPDVAAAARAELGLRAVTLDLVDLNVAGELITAQLAIEGRPRVLELTPHSSRAAGYEVRAQLEDGSWVDVEPSPVRTLRGTVAGVPGAAVAAAWLDEGLFAYVRMPGGVNYWVEPVGQRIGVDARLHAVYHEDDVIPTGASCGADALHAAVNFVGEQPAGEGGVAGSGGPLCTAELACDADFDYYTDWGSDVTAVEDRINLVIDTVNLQYELQVGITHLITTILVRTSDASDPYTLTDPGGLLNQFRNVWVANHGNIQRDIAELFTGKNLDGSVIGIAWLSAVCESLGYSVVQSDFNGSFSCATDLTAHELGHNWAAGHCSCPGFTMNPSITCANSFSATSQGTIAGFRNTRDCLDCTGSLAFTFPSGTPETVSPDGGTVIDMIVGPEGSDPQPGTGIFHMIVDGGPLLDFPMTETAPNEYTITLPAFACGSVVDYSFTAETTEGDLVTSPPGAPENSYMAVAAVEIATVFTDDFEVNLGWTVSGNAADGHWERAIPISINVCDRGNPGGDADGSGQCYLTDNTNQTCNSDVDDGSTTLTSPIMDASQGAAVISYERWFNNAFGDFPFEDTFIVEVSDDGGSSWSLLEAVGPIGEEVSGGWFRKVFGITSAGISATDQFRIRFTANDLINGSIVEAGVDAVTLRTVNCGADPNCPWDLDGGGDVGINDFLTLLGSWGPNPGHPADFDGDGEVGITDFLKLLGVWGPCP